MAEEQQNGHSPEAEIPEIDIESGGGSNTSPGVKGLYIQPFPTGQQSNPVDRFMRGSNKPEDFLILTNVNDYEISQAERIMFFRNIGNFANGRMDDVMLMGYNLRRARHGQASHDVVAMISGQRQAQQRDWESRQGRMMQQANGNNPLKNSGAMMGG